MGSNYKKHFAGLDELRGIACLMVMCNHFSSYKYVYGIGDDSWLCLVLVLPPPFLLPLFPIITWSFLFYVSVQNTGKIKKS
jgi:surface polysaccharide O-acyltransferase-like enzyme